MAGSVRGCAVWCVFGGFARFTRQKPLEIDARSVSPGGSPLLGTCRECQDIIALVGCVQPDDVVGIVSTFFSRGDKDTKAKFDAVLAKSGEVTLEITTPHPH